MINQLLNEGDIKAAQHVVDEEIPAEGVEPNEKTGAWVPLKSLSQGTQGLWNVYTVSTDQKNQYQVSKEIVELIHVEGNNAYISGTVNTGDMVVSGGAEQVIDSEILRVN